MTQQQREIDARMTLRDIFAQSMSLHRGDTVAAVVDGRTYELHRPACDAATELGLHFLVVHYPVHLQKEFVPPLPPIYYNLFEEAQGVITPLTEAPACLKFRVAMVTLAQQRRCRVVHMPGVDLHVLASSLNTPFQEIAAVAPIYQERLSRGHSVEVVTRDWQGAEHRLTFSIAERQAHADGGTVQPGEVINFPTGEAYIAPIEGTAEGSIVINGSVPNGVLRNREVILRFREGAVVPAEISGTAQAQISTLLESLRESALADGGNSYMLGEFGVGCNRAYAHPTGRQIVDEKIAGTVHIALGDNRVLGGNINAATHLDLILYPVAVSIDDSIVDLPRGGGE